jgi:peptidoglycan/LPS O-acetylase OafA/YrhL
MELDAIRGLAIALVVIFHYFVATSHPQPGSGWDLVKAGFSYSWAGVDLFLVLSGFLIGGILLRHRETKDFYVAFYVRRAARLLPLYLAMIILYAAASPWLLASGTDAGVWLVHGEGTALPVWNYLLYVQNILMSQTINWGGHWLAPTWSLAVEEQFYLVAPLLLRVVPANRLVPVLGMLIVAGIATRAAMFTASSHWLPGSILLITRWDALFIGILGAFVMADPKLKAKVEQHAHLLPGLLAVMLVGVALMIASGATKETAGMAFLGFTYLAVTSLVAIGVALFVKTPWTAVIFRNRFLAYLGTISYGIYLLHQAVIGLLCHIIHGYEPGVTNAASAGVAVLAVFVTIGLADLSWRYLEKPILNLGHRWGYQATASGPARARTA